MRTTFRAFAIASTLLCLSVTAAAATSPADAIKYRKAVMNALAAHVSGLSLINFGKVEHQTHLQAHATAIADLGAQSKVLFPAGTESGNTDALPLIWKEQKQFNELLDKLQASTAKLRDAAIANDKAGMNAAFKGMGESCKGCHDRYRKSDE
jgi:cytochrome c556